MQRCGGSSHQLFDPVLLPLVSQPHSTALPSPKRYDKRYEETFQENIRPHHRPRGHGGPEDVEGTQVVSSVSATTVNIPLRVARMASKGLRYLRRGECPRRVTGDSNASSSTFFQPWHR